MGNIYHDPSNSFNLPSCPLFDTEKAYDEKDYSHVYFYIDSRHYRYPFNYYDGYEKDTKKWKDELYALLLDLGWTIEMGRSSGVCDSAHNGKENLYLHPQSLSGVIKKSSIREIHNALTTEGTKTFKFRYACVFEDYFDMDDGAYMKYLDSKRDFLRTAIYAIGQTTNPRKRISEYDLIHLASISVYRHRVGKINEKTYQAGPTYSYVQKLLFEAYEEKWMRRFDRGEVITCRACTAAEAKRNTRITNLPQELPWN